MVVKEVETELHQTISSKTNSRLRTSSFVLDIVLVASFSALFVVFRNIPTFPMLGIPGASFRAGDFVAPLYGVVLGPLLGPLAVATGTIVAYFAGSPPQLLGLDFLPASTCAAIVGLATRRMWKLSVALNITVLALFVSLPFTVFWISVGSSRIPYNWLHLAGLVLLVSPFAKRATVEIARDWTNHVRPSARYWEKQFVAMMGLAFAGTLAQHVMGGVLTQLRFGLYFHSLPIWKGQVVSWEAYWTFIFWLYPVERALIAAVAAVLAASSIIALKRSGLAVRLPRM